MTEEKKEGEENKDDLEFFDELHLEDFQDYEDLIAVVTDYKNGAVDKQKLKEKLFELRFRKLSDEDLDRIVGETDFTKDGKISIFNILIFLKKIIDAGTKEKFSRIKKRTGDGLFRVKDPANYKRKARPYSDDEKNKYAKMINKILKDDPDCKGKIPIDPSNDELFDKIRDGVILCKLVNKAEPGTIPEDAIKKNDDMNVYDKYANLEKAIDGAKKAGCKSETTPDDVLDKDKARDEDLLGAILARINLPKETIKNKLGYKNKRIFISVGNFIYRKGYDLFLNAIKDLRFDDIAFIIIGSGEEKENYLNMEIYYAHNQKQNLHSKY